MRMIRTRPPLLGALFSAAFVITALSLAVPAGSAETAESEAVFVKIHADWCGTCQRLNPTWTELQSEFGDRADFVVLDVTDKDAVAKSRAEAERRGIVVFFDSYKSKTGTVAILDAGSGEPRAIFKGELAVDKYRAALPGGGA